MYTHDMCKCSLSIYVTELSCCRALMNEVRDLRETGGSGFLKIDSASGSGVGHESAFGQEKPQTCK